MVSFFSKASEIKSFNKGLKIISFDLITRFINRTTSRVLFLQTPRFEKFVRVSVFSFWIKLFRLYSHFSYRPLAESYLFLKVNSVFSKKATYRLYWQSKKNRLFFNLYDKRGLNYCSLNIGIFMSAFKYKKSIRKTKLLKQLLVKFLRKVLLITSIRRFNLFIRKTPTLFNELFYLFRRPLGHIIKNPVSGTVIDEVNGPTTHFTIPYIMCLEPKPFNYLKTRKRGRIKRKIRRKLVLKNKVID